MDKVKSMIVRLLSQDLSMKDFETWLYNDEYINNRILDDEDILELLFINLKSKNAKSELEKYLYGKFGEEIYIIEQVKVNCEVLLNSKINQNDVYSFLSNIGRLYDWDKDYKLISQVYWFDDEWNLAMDGYSDKYRLKKEILAFAEGVLKRLSKADENGAIEVLNEGVEVKLTNEITPTLNETISSSNIYVVESDTRKKRYRKWFEFWK